MKTYSSGMYMRLGFAVAIHVDPDVLLVDEVLAVGDEGFTHKCLDKFAEFRRRSKTILLVTHSLDLVERFCDEALWLETGAARAQGDPKRVVGAYLTDVEKSRRTASWPRRTRGAKARRGDRAPTSRRERCCPTAPVETATAPATCSRPTEGRWGSREVEITDVDAGRRGRAAGHVFHSGDRCACA